MRAGEAENPAFEAERPAIAPATCQRKVLLERVEVKREEQKQSTEGKYGEEWSKWLASVINALRRNPSLIRQSYTSAAGRGTSLALIFLFSPLGNPSRLSPSFQNVAAAGEEGAVSQPLVGVIDMRSRHHDAVVSIADF